MGKENKQSKGIFPKYVQSMVSFLHPLKNHCAVVVYIVSHKSCLTSRDGVYHHHTLAPTLNLLMFLASLTWCHSSLVPANWAIKRQVASNFSSKAFYHSPCSHQLASWTWYKRVQQTLSACPHLPYPPLFPAKPHKAALTPLPVSHSASSPDKNYCWLLVAFSGPLQWL